MSGLHLIHTNKICNKNIEIRVSILLYKIKFKKKKLFSGKNRITERK